MQFLSCCNQLRLFYDLLALINIQLLWYGFKSFSWGYFTVFKGWVVETLSADWFVTLFASNKLDLLWFNSSLSECCWFCAVYANSCQFINFFCQWYKVNDISERFTLECAVQSGDNNDNSSISKIFSYLNDIFEKLSFIDADDIILLGFFKNIF